MTIKDKHSTLVPIPADINRYDRQIIRLRAITKELLEYVNEKDFHYGSSWRKRGGAGAFFVMARKWDRIEQACETLESSKYNIFDVFDKDDRSETILDDCLDLVGYLLILIDHMIEVGYVTKIDALRIKFDPAPKVESTATWKDKSSVVTTAEPTGMQTPCGFDEEMDAIPEEKE